MSMQRFILGLANKKLVVKKMGNVTGAVGIHFANKQLGYLNIVNSKPVDLFAIADVTADDIRKSNVEQLLMEGHLQIV